LTPELDKKVQEELNFIKPQTLHKMDPKNKYYPTIEEIIKL